MLAFWKQNAWREEILENEGHNGRRILDEKESGSVGY